MILNLDHDDFEPYNIFIKNICIITNDFLIHTTVFNFEKRSFRIGGNEQRAAATVGR